MVLLASYVLGCIGVVSGATSGVLYAKREPFAGTGYLAFALVAFALLLARFG